MTKIKEKFERLVTTISSKEKKINPSIHGSLSRLKKALEFLGDGPNAFEVHRSNRAMLNYLDSRVLGLTLI